MPHMPATGVFPGVYEGQHLDGLRKYNFNVWITESGTFKVLKKASQKTFERDNEIWEVLAEDKHNGSIDKDGDFVLIKEGSKGFGIFGACHYSMGFLRDEYKLATGNSLEDWNQGNPDVRLERLSDITEEDSKAIEKEAADAQAERDAEKAAAASLAKAEKEKAWMTEGPEVPADGILKKGTRVLYKGEEETRAGHLLAPGQKGELAEDQAGKGSEVRIRFLDGIGTRRCKPEEFEVATLASKLPQTEGPPQDGLSGYAAAPAVQAAAPNAAAPKPASFEVTVEQLGGASFTLELSGCMRLGAIQEKITGKTGVASECQQVVWGTVLLEEKMTLEEYGISGGAALTLVEVQVTYEIWSVGKSKQEAKSSSGIWYSLERSRGARKTYTTSEEAARAVNNGEKEVGGAWVLTKKIGSKESFWGGCPTGPSVDDYWRPVFMKLCEVHGIDSPWPGL
eukprot:TRINITY_DN95314_c0_g1_i1.p1 TRINITY_DN95314_c0_g1~~TRINITY_DN95314_c0_g1_i1.p1  ORF type:complete len:453 (+),score=98.69 TRINITY_DN95314_c0_g1_i1:64-1422(+)